MSFYTIREVSKMFDLPPSTLRYYEEVGILTNVEKNPAGQRRYADCHINRLRTICCFKHTGMSIAQLQQFFLYAEDEPAHIGDILALLAGQEQHITEQIAALQQDHLHVLRKLCYYEAIQRAQQNKTEMPQWKSYRDCPESEIMRTKSPAEK